MECNRARGFGRWLLMTACLLAAGCQSLGVGSGTPLPPVDVPRELKKVSLPDYVIEPPDILLIDAVAVLPRGPYRAQPLDVLFIEATPSFPEQPISGQYTVTLEGYVTLGPGYGAVFVAGLTMREAAEAIRRHLAQVVDEPFVSVTLVQTAALQQIAGEHLVAQDGTVNLGVYGRVHVAGMTLDQARGVLEQYLSQFLQRPRLSVRVAGYNSKVYYIITEGAGLGDGVVRVPITGNETVLDAVAQIQGLSQVSSKRIWIARPAPDYVGCDQVLPVDWVAITKGGATATNYQILPGDRVFIAEDELVAFNTFIDKLLSPFERMFGFTLLATETIQAINRFPTGVGAGGVIAP
ncbi:MAG: polysaccharide biosynthesis/export family protein [Planctomycetes bacterium]|nr:polysaccharide biosynthesis/export family protein [Planctomycetota bacterium]